MNKNRILLPLTLLLLLTGCHRETLMSREAQAAYLYYQTYADQEGLTVAFVGDYIVDTLSLTAVMLQAQDSMAWVWLMDNLGLSRHAEMIEDLLQYKNMENARSHHISQSTDDAMQHLEDLCEADSSSKVEYDNVTVLDVIHKTVWLFFYCDTVQMRALIEHLFSTNKSIMVDCQNPIE